jgi:glycosyltransferase involved in cell wall biosynthesis
MKVADFRDNGHVGGISTGFLRQYSHLKEMYEIDFYYFGRRDDYLGKEARKRGYAINQISARNGFSFRALIEVINILRLNNYNVVIVRGYRSASYIYLASFLVKNVQLIKILHGRPVTDTFRRKIKGWIDDFLNYKFQSLACVSKLVCSELSSQYKRKVYYLPNCYSFERIFKNERKWDVVFVGRLEAAKGFDFFLKIFEEVDNIKLNLLVIGKGPLRLGTLKGFHSLKHIEHTNDVAEYLRDSKVLFFPSRFEGLPNVILEALGAGTMCFSTNVGGVSEILGDMGCDYVNFNNHQRVKDTLLELVNSYPNTTLIMNGWKKLEESYSPEKFKKCYKQMMNEILFS